MSKQQLLSEPTLRIVLVEDEAAIAMLLSEVLAGVGHEICAIAATEDAAVEAAGRHAPDLMIVDARLHAGDGVSAMARILQARYVPHLFISGDRLMRDGLRPGAVVLQKPFNEAALGAAINRALQTSAAA